MQEKLNVFEPDIKSICHPLFMSSPLDFFAFARVYDNGNCQILSTNTALYEHHFAKQHRITADIPEALLSESFEYIIPVKGPYHIAMHELRQYFGLQYPVDIIDRYCGYYDMFCFATTDSNLDMINYYLNNMHKLKKFIHFFKEKAGELIENSNKISLPDKMLPTFKGLDKSKVFYTNRERECLPYLLQGLTAKQIAKILKLSHRTVEKIILNIKQKHNCQYKSELIEKLQLI